MTQSWCFCLDGLKLAVHYLYCFAWSPSGTVCWLRAFSTGQRCASCLQPPARTGSVPFCLWPCSAMQWHCRRHSGWWSRHRWRCCCSHSSRLVKWMPAAGVPSCCQRARWSSSCSLWCSCSVDSRWPSVTAVQAIVRREPCLGDLASLFYSWPSCSWFWLCRRVACLGNLVAVSWAICCHSVAS